MIGSANSCVIGQELVTVRKCHYVSVYDLSNYIVILLLCETEYNITLVTAAINNNNCSIAIIAVH